MDLTEKTIDSKSIYQGKILNLKLNTVLLPNGKTAKREIVEHKNGVGVLPVTGDDMIFVKQFRPAIGSDLLEIPAGLVEDGESPEATGIRELREEIGLKPVKLEACGRIWPTPGCCDEQTFLFIATQFEKAPLEQDADEFIETVKLPIVAVKKLYDANLFTDAKTVAALGYYFSHH